MEKTAKTVRKQKEDTHNLNALSRRLSESMEIVTLLLLATFSVCTEQCEWASSMELFEWCESIS